MSSNHPSPRDVARPFTPELSALIEDPLFSRVWERPGLSKRDRSLITVAALVVLYRPEQLPTHLRMANTHLAFYGGYPAAVSASGIAHETLGNLDDGHPGEPAGG
jgi:4-carboxymuconolactone decarboxylase